MKQCRHRSTGALFSSCCRVSHAKGTVCEKKEAAEPPQAKGQHLGDERGSGTRRGTASEIYIYIYLQPKPVGQHPLELLVLPIGDLGRPGQHQRVEPTTRRLRQRTAPRASAGDTAGRGGETGRFCSWEFLYRSGVVDLQRRAGQLVPDPIRLGLDGRPLAGAVGQPAALAVPELSAHNPR